jgi:type I site-specific restriction endonuclease
MATPAAFIERNTFQLFRYDGIPTFNCPYRDAVNKRSPVKVRATYLRHPNC